MSKINKSSFIGGQIGSFASFDEAVSTNESIEGMDLFRNAAESLLNVSVHYKKGNLFEYINATKFNINAAENSMHQRMLVTASDGRTHDPVDLEIINSNGQVIDKIQSKVSDDPKWIAEQFEQVKYNDMLLNTTSDKVEKVRNILIEKGNYDAANRVVDFQSSNSENLDLEQVIFASKHPEIFSTYIESVEVIEEALANGAYALVAGALIKGASDIIKGTYSDNKVKLSKDITTTAKRSGIVGLGGTIIRVGAAKQNLNVFNQGNVAVTIASGTINVGNVLMDFTKGNISGTKAIELIGQNGVSSLSSIFLGLASGSVLGPAGGLVGSIGGYIISQSLYQSSISIAKNADLEKEQFDLLQSIYNQSCKNLIKINKNFTKQSKEFKLTTRKNINQILKDLDLGLKSYNFSLSTKSLTKLSQITKQTIGVTSLSDFELKMNSDKSITL